MGCTDSKDHAHDQKQNVSARRRDDGNTDEDSLLDEEPDPMSRLSFQKGMAILEEKSVTFFFVPSIFEFYFVFQIIEPAVMNSSPLPLFESYVPVEDIEIHASKKVKVMSMFLLFFFL